MSGVRLRRLTNSTALIGNGKGVRLIGPTSRVTLEELLFLIVGHDYCGFTSEELDTTVLLFENLSSVPELYTFQGYCALDFDGSNSATVPQSVINEILDAILEGKPIAVTTEEL